MVDQCWCLVVPLGKLVVPHKLLHGKQLHFFHLGQAVRCFMCPVLL